MYLLIHPKGGKYWRLDYRFEGRRKTLAMGTHPETSLKEARKKRDRARSDIEGGIDPSGHQNGNPALGDDSFETVAREWHEKYRSQWTEGHASTTLRRLEANLLPWLGKRPLGAIEPPELLRSLRRVENRGAVEDRPPYPADRVSDLSLRCSHWSLQQGPNPRPQRCITTEALRAFPHHHRPKENRRSPAGTCHKAANKPLISSE